MVPPDPAELRALIDRIASGERAALLALIEQIGPWLHGAILRMVGDRIAAGVLLEESFGEIWAHAPLYDEYAGDPWTWMMTVARSRAMTWRDLRRAKAKVPALVPEDLLPREGSPVAALDADDARILQVVFHDGLPGGESGAADRQRFDDALRGFAAGREA